MSIWQDVFSRTLRSAIPPAVTTTVTVAVCGHIEQQNAAAPINAISHILWGDSAARQEQVTVKHTMTGVGLNTAAMIAWTGVYEAVFGEAARRGNVRAALLGGTATAALAYFTDYHVVPKRLTPGFEKRLSGRSLFFIYCTLALSIPLCSLREHDGR